MNNYTVLVTLHISSKLDDELRELARKQKKTKRELMSEILEREIERLKK